MRKYCIDFILKNAKVNFCGLAFLIFLLVPGEASFAQSSRIAIVNVVDSTLIYKHIGLSAFKDKVDTFTCQFNIKQYIDRELTRIVSTRYTVSFVSIPESLFQPKGDFSSLLNNNQDAASWITNLKDQFDFIIFVETGEQDDLMDTKKQKLRSSGLYSRGNPVKSWVAVFTTCRFTAIRPSNLEVVDYDLSGMDYLLPINEFQFSRQDLLIDTEMLPVIKSALIKLIDYKLEYFLTNSFLMPNVDYEKLVPVKSE
jgi:hypothetical protein